MEKIECIAEFAASMAFSILQSCPKRYILQSSILMQHQMSLTLGGNIKNINSYLNYINDLSVQLNKRQADRLNLTETEFNYLVQHDWWVSGYNALEHNMADEVINVLCSSDLINSEDEIFIETFFAKIKVNFSRCPLILHPKDVDAEMFQHLTPYISDMAINEIKKGNYYTQF